MFKDISKFGLWVHMGIWNDHARKFTSFERTYLRTWNSPLRCCIEIPAFYTSDTPWIIKSTASSGKESFVTRRVDSDYSAWKEKSAFAIRKISTAEMGMHSDAERSHQPLASLQRPFHCHYQFRPSFSCNTQFFLPDFAPPASHNVNICVSHRKA